MHLSRKAAAGAAASAAAALMSTGMGTAHADYDYYGSFAVADRGDQWSIGYAYNAPDQGRADADAMDQCGYSNCVVELRWNNGCAALVDRDGRLYTGLGNNLAAAERNALAASGPDPNPLMVSLGSADPSQASVLISKCTA